MRDAAVNNTCKIISGFSKVDDMSGAVCYASVVRPPGCAHPASYRNCLHGVKLVEVPRMGQMRLELLQISSVCCLADVFSPVNARRTLAALASICLLWDRW